MSKASTESKSVQDVTEFPLFNVVLLDADGNEQGQIGYRFYGPGANAVADGWNKLPSGDREDLTAEIRPFEAEAENVFDRKLREGKQRTKEQTSQVEHAASDASYGIVVTHSSGKVALLNSSYKCAAKAEIEAANWHTDTTRAVVAPLDRFQDFEITLISFMTKPENFEAEYEAAEARNAAELEEADSSALDEQDPQGDDLSTAMYNQSRKAIGTVRGGQNREWLILVSPIGGEMRIAPGLFTKSESKEWIVSWQDMRTSVRRVKLRDDVKLYERQTMRQLGPV